MGDVAFTNELSRATFRNSLPLPFRKFLDFYMIHIHQLPHQQHQLPNDHELVFRKMTEYEDNMIQHWGNTEINALEGLDSIKLTKKPQVNQIFACFPYMFRQISKVQRSLKGNANKGMEVDS